MQTHKQKIKNASASCVFSEIQRSAKESPGNNLVKRANPEVASACKDEMSHLLFVDQQPKKDAELFLFHFGAFLLWLLTDHMNVLYFLSSCTESLINHHLNVEQKMEGERGEGSEKVAKD